MQSKQNNSLGTMVAIQKVFRFVRRIGLSLKPTFSEELVGLGKAMNLKKRTIRSSGFALFLYL